MKVRHIQFPLHPETPEGGLLIRDLFKGRNIDIEGIHARMKQIADAEGLPWGGARERTYNSRRAQELAKWAESRGVPAIHDALYRAYFANGVDISDVNELAKIAESVGLPGDEARRAIEDQSFAAAVDADWARARALGITGVPTFVIGRRGVVGAQPYEVLEKLATASGAKKRGG